MPRHFTTCAALLASLLMLGSASRLLGDEAQPDYAPPPLPEAQDTLPLQEGTYEYYGSGISPACGDEYWTEEFNGCCAPLCWTLQLDALFLRRTEGAIVPLVNGAAPYGVESLDLPFRFGPRVSLFRRGLFGTNFDAEITYFGVDGWSKVLASEGADTFFTNPQINFGPNTVSSNLREKLYSTEFNVRYALLDDVTLISGFRIIEVSSDLFTDIGGIASHRVNVNNHLYGYQIGIDGRLLSRENFDLNAFAKAGIYGNSADQGTSTVGIGGAAPVLGAQAGNVAFEGEVGLYFTYRFCDWFGLRGGYQVIWLDGIATAPNQIATTNIDANAPAAAMNFAETLIYHGGFFGLEMSW